MTDSPTGFTYREKDWRSICPETAPRKVVLAALREAKFEGFSHTTGHGGTAQEVRQLLTAARARAHMAERAARQKERRDQDLLSASDVNDFLRSLDPM